MTPVRVNVQPRKLLPCPNCGYGKSRKTHKYATYRVFDHKSTLTLKCKTCSHEMKFRYIQGGTPNE